MGTHSAVSDTGVNLDEQHEPRSAVSRDKALSLGMRPVEHLHRDPSLTHPTVRHGPGCMVVKGNIPRQKPTVTEVRAVVTSRRGISGQEMTQENLLEC